jgi:serine/threonine protein kinase
MTISRIGSHRVIDHIGYGLQADIYKIEYDTLGYSHAVLKQFRENAHQWQIQLNNEYKSLKKLRTDSKPHSIPTILQQNPQQRYIIIEYITGRPMYVPLNKRKAFMWWFRLAEAVMYAHEHGVYHCDVNPDNVLVDGETVFLLDWASSVRKGSSSDLRLPRGAWQPPEQAHGQLGRRTDVYSLSATLLWLISGCKPRDQVFQGQDRRSKQVIQSVIEEPLTGTRCHELAKSLEKGTAGDPSLRYNSVKWLYSKVNRWYLEENL